jgi:hypothetical protein
VIVVNGHADDSSTFAPLRDDRPVP